MGYIQQKVWTESLIPTPSSWYWNLFIDDITYKPKVKIPSWVVLDLEWPTGATWPVWPEATFTTSTKTANYTTTINDDIILVDTTSWEITITLLTAVWNAWKVFSIKKISTVWNNVIINTTSSKTIDWELTQTLIGSQYPAITITSDWNNWFII